MKELPNISLLTLLYYFHFLFPYTFFGLGLLYTAIALVSGTMMLIYHYKLTKNPTPEFAWKAYKVTAPYLVIIFIGVAIDALFYYRI